MKLKIFTVFNKVDGACEQLFCARSEIRFVREFVDGIEARNRQLSEKKYPTINLAEYEIRCVGEFDDETSQVVSCTPRVVPFVLPSDGE